MGAKMLGIDFNRIVQVGNGKGYALTHLTLRPQHERLWVEWFQHDSRRRLGAWIHTKDHATLGKYFADRYAILV